MPDDVSSSKVFLLVPTRPSPETTGTVGDEFSLRMELHPDWAVQPLALIEEDGRPMLVLDDLGGEPLDRHIPGADRAWTVPVACRQRGGAAPHPAAHPQEHQAGQFAGGC